MKKYLLAKALEILLRRNYRGGGDYRYDRYNRYGHLDPIFYRNHKRKRGFSLKWIAAILVVGTIGLGGLAIWGTIAAFNSIHQVAKPHLTEQNYQVAKEKVETLVQKPITTQACIHHVTGLLSPQRWLTVPIQQIWTDLKTSCYERKEAKEKTTNTAELLEIRKESV